MKKTLKRTGAIGLAAATIVTGLSFGPAAVAAPTGDASDTGGSGIGSHAAISPDAIYTGGTLPAGRFSGPLVLASAHNTFWSNAVASATTLTSRTHSTPSAAAARSDLASFPGDAQVGPVTLVTSDGVRCLSVGATSNSRVVLATCDASAPQQFTWTDESNTVVTGRALVRADAPPELRIQGSSSSPGNRLVNHDFASGDVYPATDLRDQMTSHVPSYVAADDTVSLRITGGEKNADVTIEDMSGDNGTTGRTDADGNATITLSSLLSAGETVRMKYGESGTWETVSTGRLPAIGDLQVVRGDDGSVTVSGKASGMAGANVYVGPDRLSPNAVQIEKAAADNTFSFVLNDAAAALSTGYIYSYIQGVRTEIAINGFSGKVDSVDIPNRTAVISGTAAPGSFVLIDTAVPDQVQAGTDGRWSHTVTDLTLGSNPIPLSQYENGEKTGETTLDVVLDVTPVRGAVSFPTDLEQDAVLSGTAHPGSTVVIRDVDGDEIARTEARLGSGAWSTPIGAPDAGGDYDVRVHQEIDGEANGEIVVTVAYGAGVAITTPAEGMAHDGGPVTLRGTGEVGAQVTVREQGRSTVLGSAQVLANGQWTIRTTDVDDRKHVLEASQTGKGNNTTASTVTLNPENDAAAPADLTLTSHEDGDTFAQPGATTLSGKATPKATVTAYWFGKDYPQYATTTAANDQGDYSISRNMGGTQPYNITLTQTAQAGKVNEVTVRLVPAGVGPVDLTVGSHQDGDAFAPTGQTTISGKASSGATVTFYWFGKDYPQYATTTVANAQGDYSISRGLGGTKPYDIVITQPAQAGKISEVTLRLVPEATGPADLTVSSHQDGDAFAPTGLTTIRGKASSNATVTFYWFGKDYPQYATTTVANAQGDYTMARGLGGTKAYDIVISQPEQDGKVSEMTLRLVPTPIP
jgi:hypothetical protein